MNYENLSNYEQQLMAKHYIEDTKLQDIKVALRKFWVDVFAFAEKLEIPRLKDLVVEKLEECWKKDGFKLVGALK
jgi:hypothetical protein